LLARLPAAASSRNVMPLARESHTLVIVNALRLMSVQQETFSAFGLK
jgi:hypothetical protein